MPAYPSRVIACALPSPVIPASSHRALRRATLAWFEGHGRELDFRTAGRLDPWGVLVSEVMAQQTQIARVEERWPAFMAAFPTAEVMAAATPADVIRAWRGLGYNRRALALHRAAVAIVAAGGAVPDDVAGLQALPGVGPYTARAVAAIAFGRPVGAVDVNVRRVVGRIVAGDPGLMSPAELQAAADLLVDPSRPGTWTHAVMDLGATICRPTRPDCGACPVRRWCAAAATANSISRGGPAAMRTPIATGFTGAMGTPTTRPRGRSSRAPAIRFEQTSRWLRGRIVDRLRDAPAGVPLTLHGPLGTHSADAVAAALDGLLRDGIIELDAAGRARLPGAVPS
jgi:A/G-specific adenine glycosylase